MIPKIALWTVVLTTALANGPIEPNKSTTPPTEPITKSQASLVGQNAKDEAATKTTEKDTNQTISEQNEDTIDKTKNVEFDGDHSGESTDDPIEIDTTTVTLLDTTTSKQVNETTPSLNVNHTSDNNNRAAKVTISVVLSAIVLLALVAFRKYKKRQMSMEHLALTETIIEVETL